MIVLLVARTVSVNCSDVFEWQYGCDDPQLSDWNWAVEHCTANNSWDQPCEVYAGVECDGARNFTRPQWFPNHKGKHYGTAVLLSFFFGIFGIDRLYLGYHLIALVKLLTGGFFFIEYLFDSIAISIQLVGPANGQGYSASKPFPFLMRNPHHGIL
jgi:TM2 domain-containing membrane protein YozV